MESQVYIAICEDVEAELKLLANMLPHGGRGKGLQAVLIDGILQQSKQCVNIQFLL